MCGFWFIMITGGDWMKAIIYFSFSKNQSCKEIASTIEGDHYEINPNTKVKGFYFLWMFYMGFKTVMDRKVTLEQLEIDFDQYDEIHVVFPVWAGRPSVYMKSWLVDHQFQNKKVYLHASSDSGNNEYIEAVKQYIDPSNQIVESMTYKKAIKQ